MRTAPLSVVTGLVVTLVAGGAQHLDLPADSPWQAGKGMVLTAHPDGGPEGGSWREVRYEPEGYASLALAAPAALEPGTVLRAWVKGNGTEDNLWVYLFGGEGHRAYRLPLKETAWRQVSLDVTDDFGENAWTWATPRRLDLGRIRALKLFAPRSSGTDAGPAGIGSIAFVPPVKSTKPSVLLLTRSGLRGDPAKEYRTIPHLREAGFEVQVRLMYGLGSATYIAADQLARFNAVIVLDLPSADKGAYPRNFDRVAAVLHEYAEAGGGLLLTAMPSGWNVCLPTINRFLERWGAQLLNEQVVDPETLAQSPAWFHSYPFSWTGNLGDHPVCKGVNGTWYPAKAWRADGILTTVASRFSDDWTVVLRGNESAVSVRPDGGKLVTQPPVTYASAPPIMSVRQAGKGRVAVLPVSPSFLTGGCDHPAWRSLVWDGEANRRRSGMKTLFLNTVRWLAEPSEKAGTFGGYAEPTEEPDYRPQHLRPVPLDWSKTMFRDVRHEDYTVLIGMRSALSGGPTSADAMLAAAKSAGYRIAVFTERLPAMDAGRWEQLVELCGKASGDEFLALPGIRYRDPQGNRYLMFGTFDWPDEEWYAKCFNSKGEVIDTYTQYAKVSGWRHVVIHSLGQGHNHVLHLRHYSGVAVFTYEGGRLLDDAYSQYLLLEENCYYPIPLAVHFVETPGDVEAAAAGFQTRLWARSMDDARDKLDGGKAGSSYFWNPKPTYLSSGVRLLDWQELNMNSWRTKAPGTDRWRFRFKVESQHPLAEVRVMDGTRPFRCFRPGTTLFEHVHTGYHGKQNQFTLRARDQEGGEMISSHLKTHTMEHVFFMCGDRQNSLGEGSWGYQTWPAQYGTAPKIDIYDLFPPHWDGTAPGHSSFCTATIRSPKAFDARNENSTVYMASTNRTVFASRDCTITELTGDKKFLPPGRTWWSDCKPTAPLADRELLTQKLTRYHFRVPDGVPGFMLVEGTVDCIGGFETVAGAGQLGVTLYSMGDRGGKNGELDHFVYCAQGGRPIVGHTPPGTPQVVKQGTAARGDYFAEFPRRLGSPAIFPLTDVAYRLYANPSLFGTVFGVHVPEGRVSAGTSWAYRFLYSVFVSGPGELNETPERIRRSFGLAGDPGYQYDIREGRVTDTTYWLRSEADSGRITIDLARTDLPGGLPVVVDGLNDGWSAVLAGRGADARVSFIGVHEGTGYGLVDLRDGPLQLFMGHPVRAGNAELFIQLVSWGADGTTAEVHNPTETAIGTWVESSADCTWLTQGKRSVEVPPGTSVAVTF